MPAAMVEESVNTCVAKLQEACDRNVPLEIHYINPNMSRDRIDSDILIAQTRMLGVDEKRIYLDSPQCIGKQVRLCRGRKVDGYFTIQNTIYKFTTTVTDTNCMVILNREKTIVGMCLQTPTVISEGQRREDHRISVQSLEPIRVVLHEGIKNQPGQAPIDAKKFEGTMVNISRGGMAIKFEKEDRFLLKFGYWYYLNFSLPGEEEPFLFLAELRHIDELFNGQARRIGFQFLNWPDPMKMRGKIGVLNRFLSKLERSQLQKKKFTVV